MTPRILVSACLVGRPVRYDGSAKTLAHDAIARWREEDRLVVFCPEVAAGMSTPRPPAEIAGAASGAEVLAGEARVRDADGADVTDAFVRGAEAALALAQARGCAFALLTDGSPSCGALHIYDGGFTGASHAGEGVTAALLRRNGVEAFAESEIEALLERLSR